MSADRRRTTAGIMSDADIAVTAAASGAKESPKFKEKMDDIWGDENKSSDDLVAAIEAGVEDPIAAAKPAEAAPAPAPAPAPTSAPAPERPAFMPPADVQVSKTPEIPLETPAAPAAPVAASEEEEEDPIPEDISGDPKKANAWTKIRAEKKELKQKNAELERQLSETNTAITEGEVAQRIQQLEQEVEQYEERIGQYDVTQTTAFNERYTSPLITRYNRMVGLIAKATGSPDSADGVARRLLDPSANRDDIISEYPITVQAALGALLVEVDDLQGQREAAITNWKETRAVMSEQETRQGLSTLNKSIVEDTNKAVEALRLEGNYLYMLSESDDNWNKGVKERIAALQGTLKSGGQEDMVKLVADGLTSRVYREWYEKEHERADKLAAQLNAKLRSAPDIGGAPGGPVTIPKSTKPMSIETGMKKIWGDDESF